MKTQDIFMFLTLEKLVAFGVEALQAYMSRFRELTSILKVDLDQIRQRSERTVKINIENRHWHWHGTSSTHAQLC